MPSSASFLNYHAYMLRLWRPSSDAPWRFMLEDAHTGERHGFASLADLHMFLGQQTGADNDLSTLASDSGPDPPQTPSDLDLI